MVDTEHIQRALVVEEARTWLRTPYHHMGRVKGAGVDCAMLLLEVYEKCGLIPHIELPHYPMDWALHRSEEKYLGWVEKYAVKVERPLPGDVALYRFGRCVSHGAIVIGWPEIIHAHLPDRCVVLGDGTQGQLAGRLHGFYSLWGKK